MEHLNENGIGPFSFHFLAPNPAFLGINLHGAELVGPIMARSFDLRLAACNIFVANLGYSFVLELLKWFDYSPFLELLKQARNHADLLCVEVT